MGTIVSPEGACGCGVVGAVCEDEEWRGCGGCGIAHGVNWDMQKVERVPAGPLDVLDIMLDRLGARMIRVSIIPMLLVAGGKHRSDDMRCGGEGRPDGVGFSLTAWARKERRSVPLAWRTISSTTCWIEAFYSAARERMDISKSGKFRFDHVAPTSCPSLLMTLQQLVAICNRLIAI